MTKRKPIEVPQDERPVVKMLVEEINLLEGGLGKLMSEIAVEQEALRRREADVIVMKGRVEALKAAYRVLKR